MGVKQALLGDPQRRAQFLDVDDLSTLGAQQEVIDLVREFLEACYPGRFDIEASIADTSKAPLERLARLLQEDFVLMRRDEAGKYRCVAASAFFAFALGEGPTARVGNQQNIAQLHAAVGSFERDLQKPVERWLGGMAVDRPAWRSNWLLSFSGVLSPHPDRYLLNLAKRRRAFPHAPVTQWDGPDGAVRRLDRDGVAGSMFCKSEYQTFRRLPQHSEYILVGFRTHLEPMHAFANFPVAARNLAAMVRRAAKMEFREFQGLSDERIVERTLTYLDACAAAG